MVQQHPAHALALGVRADAEQRQPPQALPAQRQRRADRLAGLLRDPAAARVGGGEVAGPGLGGGDGRRGRFGDRSGAAELLLQGVEGRLRDLPHRAGIRGRVAYRAEDHPTSLARRAGRGGGLSGIGRPRGGPCSHRLVGRAVVTRAVACASMGGQGHSPEYFGGATGLPLVAVSRHNPGVHR